MAYFDDATIEFTTPSGGAGTPESFDCDVTGALLEPDVTTEIRNYLCGPKTTQRAPTWKLTLDYDQNWAADGISTYLEAHQGELADVTISSASLAQQAVCVVRIKPGPYGGTAGEIAEATVEMDVDGAPAFSAPAVQAAAARGGKAKAGRVIGFGGLTVAYTDGSTETVTTTIGDLALIGQQYGPDWRTQLEAGTIDQLGLAVYMAWVAVRRGPHRQGIVYDDFLQVVAEITPAGDAEKPPGPTVAAPGSEPPSRSPSLPEPPLPNGSTLTHAV